MPATPTISLVAAVNPVAPSTPDLLTATVSGTAPDPNTLALLPLTGSVGSQTLTELSGNSTWATQTNGVISNAQSTLGFTTSWKSSGSSAIAGGFASITTALQPTASDRTWEGWFYCTALPTGAGFSQLFAQRQLEEAAGQGVNINPDGSIQLLVSNVVGTWIINSTSAASVFPTGQWVHVAMVNHGGSWAVYVNGVSQCTGSYAGVPSNDSGGSVALLVGSDSYTVAGNCFQGYIQDVRVSSVARYTSNFTPPAAPFSQYAVPTGTVQFFDSASSLGTSTLSSGGVATLSPSFTGSGTHPLTAAYSGDSNYSSITSSPPLSLVVTYTSTTTGLVVSTNPILAGVSDTLTATVTPSSGGPATGNVAFYDGSTLIGMVALVADVAVLIVPFSTGGVHSLSAVYSGDSTFGSSTSPTVYLTVVNLSVSTTTLLTLSANPIVQGLTEVLTATVSSGSTPSGAVQFFDGSTLLGTATLTAGVATLLNTFDVTGLHNLQAVYLGDGTHLSSSSNTILSVVTPNPAVRGDVTPYLKLITSEYQNVN